jgi:hypothetical protein
MNFNIDLSDAHLEEMSVHYVGNRFAEEGLFTTAHPVHIADNTLKGLMAKYLLAPFKTPNFYQFTHQTELSLNEVFVIVSDIFNTPEALHSKSKDLTNVLYESSVHPNIKSGEFYVTYMTGCKIGHETVDVIGLFKSETKETFLKATAGADNYEFGYEDGININKLDKGCLIFNTDASNGYRVCIVDGTKRGEEALYWREHFLGLKMMDNEYVHTQNHIQFCRDFFGEKLGDHYEVKKADEIDFLNKSQKYFQDKEVFDVIEFEREVLKQPEIIDLYHSCKKDYEENNEVKIHDEFDISEQAVKSNKKFLKSVIKLDKNFHIYIHGNKDFIEHGVDEVQGLNYYKLYYKKES